MDATVTRAGRGGRCGAIFAHDPLPSRITAGTKSIIGGTARYRGLRIGLLGGSFNPAHAGHRHMSLMALSRLGLDQVWWLVSPQNPMKSTEDMAPLAARLASARNVSHHPRIRATNVETRLGTQFTADTLSQLLALCPTTHFVWLMGADNLVNFHRWQHWQDIVTMLPIAIIDRPSYSIDGLTAKMARRYRGARLAGRAASQLALKAPPCWTFLVGKRHPASATQIRASARAHGHGGVGTNARGNKEGAIFATQ